MMKYLLLVPDRIKGNLPGAVTAASVGDVFDVTAIAWKNADRSHRGVVVELGRKESESFISKVKEVRASIHPLGIPVDEWLKAHGLEKLED